MTADDTMSGPPPLPGRTQVLIAGGGPVGLAAAVELGQRGIDCVVVEPREVVSPRPAAVQDRQCAHHGRVGAESAPAGALYVEPEERLLFRRGVEQGEPTGVVGDAHGSSFLGSELFRRAR